MVKKIVPTDILLHYELMKNHHGMDKLFFQSTHGGLEGRITSVDLFLKCRQIIDAMIHLLQPVLNIRLRFVVTVDLLLAYL